MKHLLSFLFKKVIFLILKALHFLNIHRNDIRIHFFRNHIFCRRLVFLDLGGFQLLDLIITEFKSQMTF